MWTSSGSWVVEGPNAQCGGPIAGGVCWCDAQRSSYGDCCGDFEEVCEVPAVASCEGSCGGAASGCWCDALCEAYGDCCADKAAVCDGPAPGTEVFGVPFDLARGEAVAVGADGAITVGGQRLDADAANALVVRFDADGQLSWETDLLENQGVAHDTAYEQVYDVAVTAGGIAYVAGLYEPRVHGPSLFSRPILFAVDADGEPLWTRSQVTNSRPQNRFTDIVLDGEAAVVAGSGNAEVARGLAMGPDGATFLRSGEVGYAATEDWRSRISEDGSTQWSVNVGAVTTDMAVAPDGAIVVVSNVDDAFTVHRFAP